MTLKQEKPEDVVKQRLFNEMFLFQCPMIMMVVSVD